MGSWMCVALMLAFSAGATSKGFVIATVPTGVITRTPPTTCSLDLNWEHRDESLYSISQCMSRLTIYHRARRGRDFTTQIVLW